ncbi:hypothetical protein [Listeria grandensis]|uniref:hypothetical protein n=1 Tax=Listeria grandensis TaxID=1494963 RepID=UPI00164EDA46|nr:hypothetical protein [Listeria grandensis]MBC6315329.1 hypothetical protein [Listeria grandensis]
MKNKVMWSLTIVLGAIIIGIGIWFLLSFANQGSYRSMDDGINIKVSNQIANSPELRFKLVTAEENQTNIANINSLKKNESILFNSTFTPKKDYQMFVYYTIDGREHRESLLYVPAHSTKLVIDLNIKSVKDGKIIFGKSGYDGFEKFTNQD